MIEVAEGDGFSAETINETMIGRALVAENALKAVELALELAGGAGFYRVNGLERRFRDIQGVRFHPLQQGPQTRYAGSLALGQPVELHLLNRGRRRGTCPPPRFHNRHKVAVFLPLAIQG